MCGDEIKEFDDAGGIDSFIAVKARSNRALRIAKIDQRYREFVFLKLLVGKAIQRGLRSPVDEILQR